MRQSKRARAAVPFSTPAEIEPEKEIVLTIVDPEQVEPVGAAIRSHSDIEKDGHGILFVLPITDAYGIK